MSERQAQRFAECKLSMDSLQARLDAQRRRAEPAQEGSQPVHVGSQPVHVFLYLRGSLRAAALPPFDVDAGWCHVRLALAGGAEERVACATLFSSSAPYGRPSGRVDGEACRAWSQHFCVPVQPWQLHALCVRAELWWSAQRHASDKPDVLIAASEVGVPGALLEPTEVRCALHRATSGSALPQGALALLSLQLTARALGPRGGDVRASPAGPRDEYGLPVPAEHAAECARAHAESRAADAGGWFGRWNALLRGWPAGARKLCAADA